VKGRKITQTQVFKCFYRPEALETYPSGRLRSRNKDEKEILTPKIVCVVVFISEYITAKTQRSQRNQLFAHHNSSGIPHTSSAP